MSTLPRDIGTTVANVASGDPRRIAVAQARMDAWSQALQRPAGDDNPPDAAPASEPSDTQAEPSAARPSPGSTGGEGFEADHSRPSGTQDGSGNIAAQLRSMAEAMRRRADALAAARAAAQGAPDDRSSDTSGASDTQAKDPTGDAPDRP